MISLKAVPQGLHLIKDTDFFLTHLISILQMVETVCVQFGGFTMQSFTLQYPTSAKKMWNAIKLLENGTTTIQMSNTPVVCNGSWVTSSHFNKKEWKKNVHFPLLCMKAKSEIYLCNLVKRRQ
jgi:hypothetical protein